MTASATPLAQAFFHRTKADLKAGDPGLRDPYSAPSISP